MYTYYSCISATDMAANNEKLILSYNTEDPLNSIIKRLNECKYFAAAEGEPVTETQIVRISYGLVYETGQYP